MSLLKNIVNSEEKFIGKKIIAMDFNTIHRYCYIIVEGGQFLCFEIDGIMKPLTSFAVQKSLVDFTELRELFLKYGCISEEEYNRYEKEDSERKDFIEKRIEEREYEYYLELKEKFSKDNTQDKILRKDVYDSINAGINSDYLKCVKYAISSRYEYLAFNGRVYKTTDKDRANPICFVEELI